VSVEFTAPEVTDVDVDRSLRALREQEAVVEESTQPVALGNRITAYVDGRLVDEDGDDAAEAETETETEEEHDHDHEGHDHSEHEHHVDDKTVIHEHAAVVTLDEEGELAPGFGEALVGAVVGDHREFELTYPDDTDEYGELAGKRVKFTVDIQKVESVTLPALNDELAARVTAEEETPLSLLELRMRIRENLEKSAADRSKNEHADKALTAMVEGADIAYPEAMIGEETERFLKRFDQDLRQRGITLDDYMRIYRKSREDLYADYRETAIRNIERSLVLREVADTEGVTVTDEQIDAEIDRNAAQFGMPAEEFRRLYNQAGMRGMLVNELLSRNVLERISAIARGEAPDLSAGAVAAAQAGEEAAAAQSEAAPEE
jgi:trigger factor